MAEKKAEGDEGEVPTKKKSKLLVIIVAAVLLIVVAGGGIAFMLMGKKHADVEEDGDEPVAKAEKAKKSKKDKEQPPVFVRLEPFTVKLQSEQQQESYLQTTPELKVLDAPVGDKIKQYMPEIRYRVLLILTGKKPSELNSPQGVQKLSSEVRKEINLILDGPKITKKGKGREEPPAGDDQPAPDDSVQAVLFTSFIIQ